MAKSSDPLNELRKLFDFPKEKPECEPTDFGWLAGPNAIELPKVITPHMKVIVELGSLFGLSARFIADCAPQATVIAVDHWASCHWMRGPFWQPYVEQGLYETFLASCWSYRNRMIPVRMHTTDGMKLLASLGVRADMIYVDAGHHYPAVKADLEACLKHWPETVLCGDDWTHPEDDGVERAVTELLPAAGYEVTVNAPFWSARKKAVTPSPAG